MVVEVPMVVAEVPVEAADVPAVDSPSQAMKRGEPCF